MKDMIYSLVQKSGIKPYLLVLYKSWDKSYWWIRKNLLHLPIKKNAGEISAIFFPDKGIANYHEFESEKKNIIDLLNSMNNEDVFYDIGSNIGIYACFAAQAYPQADIIALEPSPPAYEYLEKNINLNGGNITGLQVAITDTNGTIDFSVDKSDPLGRMSSTQESDAKIEYESELIPSRKLDTLIKERYLPTPTVVKIDVEGAEYSVLNGMTDILDSVRILYCEIHHHRLEKFDASAKDIFHLLESRDFIIKTVHERGDSELIKAINKNI